MTERDAFGRLAYEEINPAPGADFRYQKRWFDMGAMTRSETGAGDGAVYHSEFTNDERGYVGSKYFRNGVHVATLKVMFDGQQVTETRCFLPDGRLVSVSPDRRVYYVDQWGRPPNGGPHTLVLKRRLW